MKKFFLVLLIAVATLSGCTTVNNMINSAIESNTLSAYRDLTVEFYGPDRTKSSVVFIRDRSLILVGHCLMARTHFKEESHTNVPLVTSVQTLRVEITQQQYNEAAAEIAGISLEEHDAMAANGTTTPVTTEMVVKWAKEQVGFKEIPNEVRKCFTRKTFSAYDGTIVKFFPNESLPEEL